MDTKIKGLDDEMRRYKEQLKKTPNNATIKKRAMDTLKRKVMKKKSLVLKAKFC